jgi:hypothetical protein
VYQALIGSKVTMLNLHEFVPWKSEYDAKFATEMEHLITF